MSVYNPHRIWVSRLVDAGCPRRLRGHPLGPAVGAFLALGLPVDLFFLAFWLLRHDLLSSRFLFAYGLALLWLNLGPLLIWYYDQRLLPSFFEGVCDMVQEDTRLAELAERHDGMFAKNWHLAAVPWTLFVLGLYAWSVPSVDGGAGAGVYEIGNVGFFVSLLGVVWAGLLTGIGFMGVITTLFAVRAVSSLTFDLDPHHPDQLGGLSAAGRYSIGTTMLFSSGALWIPLARMVAGETVVTALIFTAVAIFSLAILASFVYPTYVIHQKAKAYRDEAVRRLGRALREARQAWYEARQAAPEAQVAPDYTVIEDIRRELDDHKALHIYPMQVRTLAELAVSVLFPGVILTIEILIKSQV